MAEYIERGALTDKISKLKTGGIFTEVFKEVVLEIISNQPTADVQEVRHGRNETPFHPADEFICSECGICFREMSSYDLDDDVFKEFYFNYCPNCGAKMDEE